MPTVSSPITRTTGGPARSPKPEIGTTMNLSIAGFGAGMMTGFPLPSEPGFLHRAVQPLLASGQFNVVFDIVDMGSVTAHQAQRQLARKVLAQRPDIVVLQFGSTDVGTPLRNGFGRHHLFKKVSHVRERVYARPSDPLHLLEWHLHGLASELLLIRPVTSLKNYLNAHLGMVYECRVAGSAVVVVSPFVMGTGRSNRFARLYTAALSAQLPRSAGIYFLDAHAVLSQCPRRKMLLGDGVHLSALAHQKLGSALASVLAEAARQQLLIRNLVSVERRKAAENLIPANGSLAAFFKHENGQSREITTPAMLASGRA